MITNRPTLLDLEFRFQAPDDIDAYGADWHRYDERAILAMPAQTLIRMEAALGAPLTDVMNGVRESSVFGDTCAAWIALRLEGKSPDRFTDFSPAIMISEWREHQEAEVEEPGKAPTPETDTATASASPPIVLTPEVLAGSPSSPPAG